MNNPHEFGPWLEPATVLHDPERRCKHCGAKEWKNDRLGTYGNELSQQDCSKRRAA